ncbi:RNA-directed DNA polymerase, eukaryota [Tanacetum coccineum]
MASFNSEDKLYLALCVIRHCSGSDWFGIQEQHRQYHKETITWCQCLHDMERKELKFSLGRKLEGYVWYYERSNFGRCTIRKGFFWLQSIMNPIVDARFKWKMVFDKDMEPVDDASSASTSLSHPPGFTPKTSVTHANVGEICEDGPTNGEDMVNMPRVDAKVMDHSQEVHDSSNGESVSSFSHKVHNGGSILDILDDMVRVGHSMGYNLDGCLGHKTKKEWVKELNCKHRINFLALQETKMDCISHMDVKSLWGNSNFDFVASDSLGNSGGILCIWEASIFKKDGATISDNFIAIYGTWLPRNVKILLVAVYAPQQPGSKRALWDFLSNLVRRWNGEAIIMGDFNDVRTMDERLGSSFNVSSARCFDRFIVSSGRLVDGKLKGFKKKLQDLKSIIRLWVKDKKFHLHNAKNSLQNDLISIDMTWKGETVSDETSFSLDGI